MATSVPAGSTKRINFDDLTRSHHPRRTLFSIVLLIEAYFHMFHQMELYLDYFGKMRIYIGVIAYVSHPVKHPLFTPFIEVQADATPCREARAHRLTNMAMSQATLDKNGRFNAQRAPLTSASRQGTKLQ